MIHLSCLAQCSVQGIGFINASHGHCHQGTGELDAACWNDILLPRKQALLSLKDPGHLMELAS